MALAPTAQGSLHFEVVDQVVEKVTSTTGGIHFFGIGANVQPPLPG